MLEKMSAVNWHAVHLYRLAARLHEHRHARWAWLVSAINRVLTGVEIEPGAKLGPGFQIYHGHGIVVNRNVRAGRDLLLFHGVTLGTNGHGNAAPVLGERVIVYAGAKVLGGVHIGDRARIGANAVVLDDVPAGATAVGIPARIT